MKEKKYLFIYVICGIITNQNMTSTLHMSSILIISVKKLAEYRTYS